MQPTTIWLPSLLLLGMLLAISFWPKVGLLAWSRRWRALRERVWLEDALKHLLDAKHRGRPATPDLLATTLGLPQKTLARLLPEMETADLLRLKTGQLHLTPKGERWALQVVRAHRLWERYLADETRLPIGKVHRLAERAEHQLTAQQVDALDAHLGYPATDPHGDPIPTGWGNIELPEVTTLTDWDLDQPARIVHIEDEPESIFDQIVAQGLRPGQVIRILERDPEKLVLSDGTEEQKLARTVAAQIQVAPVTTQAPPLPDDAVPLSSLQTGQKAEVIGIDEEVRGLTRRRLLDLGLTSGALVSPELEGSFGNTRAFRVRGTLIALRNEQASQIWIRPERS